MTLWRLEKEEALNVPGTERDQDRGGRGFSSEARQEDEDEEEDEEEGGGGGGWRRRKEEEGGGLWSFTAETLQRWGLEVGRVWYS